MAGVDLLPEHPLGLGPQFLLDLPLCGAEKALTGATTGYHMLFPWTT